MKKQIIVISEVVSTIPNILTVSVSEFLSTNTYKNAFVLVDRAFVSTPQINQIKKHCQCIGLNPFIDGSYMDVSYVFMQDWQAETEEEGFNNAILNAIAYLEECEASAKLVELEDKKSENKTVMKLIKLAKDSAASFGEKRNAINAAYKLVFGMC